MLAGFEPATTRLTVEGTPAYGTCFYLGKEATIKKRWFVELKSKDLTFTALFILILKTGNRQQEAIKRVTISLFSPGGEKPESNRHLLNLNRSNSHLRHRLLKNLLIKKRATCDQSLVCSNQLSYIRCRIVGLEPTANCVTGEVTPAYGTAF